MTLCEFLTSEYGESGGEMLRIDDCGPTDKSELCCQMYVHVFDDDRFELRMFNVPLNCQVRELIESGNGKVSSLPSGPLLTNELRPRQSGWIRKLAKAVRQIVGRGQRYEDPNWKWICPRTADSLDRLADSLWQFRHEKRNGFQQAACSTD